MSDVPPYPTRGQLIEALGICDRTLDNWIAKGFPRAGRYGRWSWKTVQAHMDGKDKEEVASPGRNKSQEIRDATAAFLAPRQH